MKNITKYLRKFMRRAESTSIIAVVFLIALFGIITPAFLSPFNVFNITRTAALYVFVALAQAMIVILGDVNVSLGAMGSFCVVILGECLVDFGLAPVAAVCLTICAGVLAGGVNGLIISRFKINPFIVTLATSYVFTGLANGISRGLPYSGFDEGFTALGKGNLFGISALVWLALVTLVIAGLFFRYTELGRKLLATGGSEPAARMSGINTAKMKLIAHCMSGGIAAVAACLWVSRIGSAQPSTGTDWMMTSVAVTVLGGTSMKGGVFSWIGFIFAGLLMAFIRNGLIMIGVNVYFEQTFLGLIILGALMIDYFRMKIMASER